MVTSLRPLPPCARTSLRVLPGSPGERAVVALLGTPLPPSGSSTRASERDLLWLGPDEWLVLGPHGSGPRNAVALQQAVGNDGAAVDVSAARTTLELTGPASRDVLATCCPLDLHPSAFPPGAVAGTLVGGVECTVHRRGDETTFRLHVATSHVAHVRDWLTAGVEGVEAAALVP